MALATELFVPTDCFSFLLCVVRSDDTNVASLRCNPLLLHKLRLVASNLSSKHVDLQQATFGFEQSRFRIYERVLNCANLEHKTAILDVNHDLIMGSA